MNRDGLDCLYWEMTKKGMYRQETHVRIRTKQIFNNFVFVKTGKYWFLIYWVSPFGIMTVCGLEFFALVCRTFEPHFIWSKRETRIPSEWHKKANWKYNRKAKHFTAAGCVALDNLLATIMWCALDKRSHVIVRWVNQQSRFDFHFQRLEFHFDSQTTSHSFNCWIEMHGFKKKWNFRHLFRCVWAINVKLCQIFFFAVCCYQTWACCVHHVTYRWWAKWRTVTLFETDKKNGAITCSFRCAEEAKKEWWQRKKRFTINWT